MSTRSVLLGLALAAHAVMAAPASATADIQKREVLAYDAIVGFNETVPATAEGALMIKYKPLLKVIGGCVPFPAVDAAGNVGGGLDITGSPSGSCSTSTGQVYARAATHENYFAIMYSWYMPKDNPSAGLGHRHDWEEAIVWLSDATEAATLVGFSVSGHGGLVTTKSPSLSGTNPLAGYTSYWPLNHQLIQTGQIGGAQPVIAWDNLTVAAQTTLQTADFGSAIVPCRDATFTSNLVKGYAGL